MVDSISNWAGNTLLQSQNLANRTAQVTQSRSAQQSARAVFDELDKTIEQGKNLMKQSSATATLTASSASAPSSNLPRGSLIDIVV